MASVREQILAAAFVKVVAVKTALAWKTALRNPRDPFESEEELNAIVQIDGGERDPIGLTGHVEERRVEFSVGLLVRETAGATAEAQLDAGYVAVSNALLNPADIQLGGLAIGVDQLGTGEPVYSRPPGMARILGAMSMDFSVRYLAREGDASTPGP